MAHQRQSSAAPIRVPRPTTASDTEDIDTNTTQFDPNTKIRFSISVDESVNKWDTPNEDTDLSPISSRKRHTEEETTKVRRKCTQLYDESHRSLVVIAESLKVIVQAIQMQVTLDTLNHVNWQLIIEKLQAMDIDLVDIIKVMKAFRSDGDLAKVFMSLTNTTIKRALMFEQLGSDSPPLP
ncbi:Uncharacterized protein Adt_17538 [Abeliophyllum distichum]|uniref:Uncharacterized protein n=1 Tax=Abeliophyllum distichum TaxID=126358 RepID=A0ABD1THB5_9LAMI